MNGFGGNTGTKSVGVLVNGIYVLDIGTNPPPSVANPTTIGTVSIRDNAGVLERQNAGGSWSPVAGRTMVIDDNFVTPLATGFVNGSAAEPGPNVVRVTADTESKMSIPVSGELTVSGGKASPAWGDPAVRWAAVTRAPGRIVVFKVRPTSVNYGNFGLLTSTNLAQQPNFGLGFYPSNVLQAIVGGVQIGDYAQDTDYFLYIVLKSVGQSMFVKGGTFTYPTLVWSDMSDSTATVYPVASGYNQAFKVKMVRSPATAVYFLPSIAYDTFTRADGALGSTEVVGMSGQAITARTWTSNVGTVAVATNKAAASALTGGIAIATAPCVSADVMADLAYTRSDGTSGLVVRYNDADNYIRAVHDGTNAKLIKRVAGSETTLIDTAATYSAGALLRVVANGTSISLFYNQLAVGTAQTVTGLTGTACGIYASSVADTFDNFNVNPIGTAGEHVALDSLIGD